MPRAEERQLLEFLPGPLIASNSDQTILYANKDACELLGYQWPRELVGEPLTIIVPERFRSQHNAGFGRYRRTGHSRLLGKQLRVAALKKDGAETTIELSIQMFRRPDGTDFIVGMLAPGGTHKDVVDLSVAKLTSKLEKRAYKLV